MSLLCFVRCETHGMHPSKPVMCLDWEDGLHRDIIVADRNNEPRQARNPLVRCKSSWSGPIAETVWVVNLLVFCGWILILGFIQASIQAVASVDEFNGTRNRDWESGAIQVQVSLPLR